MNEHRESCRQRTGILPALLDEGLPNAVDAAVCFGFHETEQQVLPEAQQIIVPCVSSPFKGLDRLRLSSQTKVIGGIRTHNPSAMCGALPLSYDD